MVLELEQRTRLFFEDNEHTVLDYVCEWQAQGETLVRLVAEISEDAKINPPLDPGAVRRWLNRHFDPDVVADRLAEARERGAHVLAEVSITEAVDNTNKDMAPVIRVRNDARHWAAERWNKRELGQQKAGVSLTLNVGSLHLDAMRTRALEAAKERAPAQTAQARSLAIGVGGIGADDGGGAIANAIVTDAEIISDDESVS